MPPAPQLFPRDEELGKRDDDHRPGRRGSRGAIWQQRQLPRGPYRRTMKRIVVLALALIGLYFFFKNMPTDLKNPTARPRFDHSGGRYSQSDNSRPLPPTTQDPIPKNGREASTQVSSHSFNGPIKFYELAVSLREASKKIGLGMTNRNVLFAASSLKSASIVLPIACEMGIRERNSVHFALMGRDDIPMNVLRSVNGMTKECKITYHDARPDVSMQSSDYRMEVSSSAALNHINTYIHPHATFVDASGEEDAFFLKGLKARASLLGRTVIELPEDAEQNLMWATLLDSTSLSAWNKVGIDILVHAPPSSSGSLIRLLDSLKKADFFSSTPPRLTIELPHEVDEPIKRYLEHFRWPPNSDHNAGSLLTLHRRIPQHSLTAEENSIRFLEAFWPADPLSSHVLVLSPHAELSPLFFHYLKYTMLEYKYSASNVDMRQELLGISLDLPSRHINDSAEFEPPSLAGSAGGGITQFLWEAPGSNAALYFGDKWAELHDFVAHLLTSQHQLPTPTTQNVKFVSKTYPSWLEHILKLSRARGYWTLYPNFVNTDALVTLHHELYQLPEEYSHETEPGRPDPSSELTADPATHARKQHIEAPLISRSLLNSLPNNGNLPSLTGLPLLTWDGESVQAAELGENAVKYSGIIRREFGGCEVSAREKERVDLKAEDLFCLEEEDPEKSQ